MLFTFQNNSYLRYKRTSYERFLILFGYMLATETKLYANI